MHACTLRARAIVQPPDTGIQLFQLIPSILCKHRLCQLKKMNSNIRGLCSSLCTQWKPSISRWFWAIGTYCICFRLEVRAVHWFIESIWWNFAPNSLYGIGEVNHTILFWKIYYMVGFSGTLSYAVFVYLCICVFVYLGICICAFDTWEYHFGHPWTILFSEIYHMVGFSGNLSYAVFVYLCVCVFVYLYFCICAFDT